MNKITPRGPTPSLIGGANGKPKRVLVQRRSHCYRCHDTLLAGVKCIELPKLGGGHASYKRMCDDCYEKMLLKTAADLEVCRNL